MDELSENTKFDKKIDSEEFKEKFEFNFHENKSLIYTVLFYCFGLFLGSYFYKIASGEALDKLIKPNEESLITLFTSDLCVYLSLFLVVVFLGFCLIGYPIINIIPLIIGIDAGLRIAYFYINYSVKGIGYSLIMIIPFTALFLTVIAYAIKISTELTKKLIELTTNKEFNKKLEVKPFLKSYLLLGLCVIGTAFLNAGMTKLLFSVVTI